MTPIEPEAMKLLNVLEINPYDYAKAEYAQPQGPAADLPAAWNSWWLRCLADHNLGHLAAIQEGSYLVDIRTIDPPALAAIVRQQLTKIELDEFQEQPGFLSGGIAVELENEIILEPMCCGDLGNLSNWEEIAAAEQNTWLMLWIGHPWVYYRRNNGRVEISNYCEQIADINLTWLLPENELFAQLAVIRAEQTEFEYKICTLLTAIKAATPPPAGQP